MILYHWKKTFLSSKALWCLKLVKGICDNLGGHVWLGIFLLASAKSCNCHMTTSGGLFVLQRHRLEMLTHQADCKEIELTKTCFTLPCIISHLFAQEQSQQPAAANMHALHFLLLWKEVTRELGFASHKWVFTLKSQVKMGKFQVLNFELP